MRNTWGFRANLAKAQCFSGVKPEDPEKAGMTVWSIFPENTKYFDPSTAPFMMNFCVEDLTELLKLLREEGVAIDPKVEEHEYGKFAWITDPEGNRIELWEPPKEG